MKSLFIKIAVCIAICLALGLFSGFSTVESINSWYRFINKPSWNPPNWIFGPVWTLLYILMGIAVALIWHTQHQNKKTAITFFVIQFALNIAWSFIFFNLHAIGWAFMEIIVMLFFIAITIFSFYKISNPAAWLMVPYLIWVLFATVLNGTIWHLNS